MNLYVFWFHGLKNLHFLSFSNLLKILAELKALTFTFIIPNTSLKVLQSHDPSCCTIVPECPSGDSAPCPLPPPPSSPPPHLPHQAVPPLSLPPKLFKAVVYKALLDMKQLFVLDEINGITKMRSKL